MALNPRPRGQAAISDALYFLMIVSALSVVLFMISVGYGNTVTDQIKRQFGSEYASSAFKTIFYSSTPRIEGQALEDTLEVDYLLARIKEDFADDEKLNSTAGTLANTIVGIMEPVQANYDYAFYIYNSGSSNTVATADAGLIFLMFSLHNNALAAPVGGKSYSADQIIFICSPDSGLDKVHALENLLTTVGSVSKSESWIRLIAPKAGSATGDLEAAQVNFAMWTSTAISSKELSDLGCAAGWKRDSATGREWVSLMPNP
ncbi:MAG: hypothetical protein PHH08_05160 [Candidatus ainarchaeum sp.]|nr:hypothetical protein [Candidatus ainarchaeum sp.]